LDFFFSCKTHALIFADFIQSQVIAKTNSSKTLVSADKSSNDYNYKHTYMIELAPICKEDVVYIPPKLQKELGGSCPICLVTRMTTMVQLLDFANLKCWQLDQKSYWAHEFKSICGRSSLQEFVVINIEELGKTSERITGLNVSKIDKIADFSYVGCEVQRLSDFGENDNRFYTRTHLGDVLHYGDHVLGYDLSSLNVPETENMKTTIPEIVLVKKCYARKQNKQKKRIWKLKHIEKEKMEDAGNKAAKKQGEKDVLFTIGLNLFRKRTMRNF
jgi:nonsense-mediated mRNA decay protein 3